MYVGFLCFGICVYIVFVFFLMDFIMLFFFVVVDCNKDVILEMLILILNG